MTRVRIMADDDKSLTDFSDKPLEFSS